MRSSRKSNEATEAALVDLTEQAGRLPIVGSSSDAVKSQLLTLLADVHAESTTRLYAASSGLPVVLWVSLIGFSFILTVFVALSSVESRLLLTLFAVTFATCISSILVLVRLLDHSFEGALGISSAGFSETLAKVSMLLHSV